MKIKRRISAVVLLIMYLCLGTIHVLAAENAGGRENIGKEIEKFVSEHGDTTAGMAVTVFDSEKEIYTGCFGFTDIENGIGTDADSVFEWGSTTKLLVWTSVMQLWERGKLDLDADVRK